MVIKNLLIKASDMLKDLDYTDPDREAILILSKLIKKDTSYIYINLDKTLEKELENKYLDYIEKRSKGYPFHYLFKEKGFLDFDLYVDEGVLIPRPETEHLVNKAIEIINKFYKDEKVKVIDLCSGSGVIGISIAKNIENSCVLGLDLEDRAIEISNINKNRLGLENIEFIKSDLFSEIEDKDITVDIIISNPPYIKTEELDSLQKDVKLYEPKIALDGGEDGLIFYREISKKSINFFNKKGVLMYEIGYNQGEDVKEILIENNFYDVEILKDIQGHDRVVLGFYKKEN